MKIVIFGLTISSSWGNGHATLWRGLCKHLVRLGHTIVFFERDVPYYAGARDLYELPGGRLALFSDWDDVRPTARRLQAAGGRPRRRDAGGRRAPRPTACRLRSTSSRPSR